MRNKTVAIVLAVAALLFAYIYFIEPDRMTTEELEGRKGRVFTEFKRDFVDRLELAVKDGHKVVLERERSDDGEGDWVIVEPRRLSADGAEVRSVLSAMDFLLVDRTVKGDAASDAKFGLDAPEVRGGFTMGGTTTGFSVGAKDGSGEKVYVSLDGSAEVFAVEADFLDSVSKDLASLRDKRLVSADLSSAGGIDAGELSLKKGEDDLWRTEMGGAWVLAREDQVTEILGAAKELSALSFMADEVKAGDLGQYGLEKPAKTVRVVRPDGDVEILFGGACGQSGQGIVATVKGSGTVACADTKLAEMIARPADRLREMRVAPVRREDLNKISITAKERGLTLNADEDGLWTMEGHGGVQVEEKAVDDLLAALSETAASEIVSGEEAAALATDAVKVVLGREGGAGDLAVSVGQGAQEGEQLVRRAGEDAVLKVKGSLLSLASADPLVFRRRLIDNGDAHDVTSLEITGSASQRLTQEDHEWMMVAPARLRADATAARAAAALVAQVPVERFVANMASAEHGLGSPFATVTAVIGPVHDHGEGDGDEHEEKAKEAGKTAVLEIGAPAGGAERYARMKGEETVFTIADDKTAVLFRPLVARDIISVDPAEVEKVSLSRGGATITATLADNEWTFEGGEGDSVTLKRLLTDLGAAKAVRGYSFDLADGFSDPTLVLKLWKGGDAEPKVITFGRRSADDADDGYLAKAQDAKASVVFPGRIVDDLAALVPSEK